MRIEVRKLMIIMFLRTFRDNFLETYRIETKGFFTEKLENTFINQPKDNKSIKA